MRYLLLLLAFFPSVAFAQTTLPTAGTCEGMGINIHFTSELPGTLSMMRAAGIGWVRMDFFWADIERKKGAYDFNKYDTLLSQLDSRHIRPWLIFDYGNPLYGDGSPRTDESRTAFADFAAVAVTHFKNRGVLWEMWNEPNIGFWKPKPDVDEYAKLAIATGKAVAAADPAAVYVGPARERHGPEILRGVLQSRLPGLLVGGVDAPLPPGRAGVGRGGLRQVANADQTVRAGRKSGADFGRRVGLLVHLEKLR